MKKVIVVSEHFPPLNSIAAKRYGYMGKYFEEYGYDMRVITMRTHTGSFLGTKNEISVPIEEEKIIRIGTMGVSYPIHLLPIALIVERYRKKGRISRIINGNAWGWYEKVKKEIDLDKLCDSDIVIGSFPSVGSLLVARYISKELQIPFVAEIRDLISDFPEEGYRKNDFEIVQDIIEEKILLRDVDLIVTVTKGFQNILKKRFKGKRIATVYNGWEKNYEIGKEGVRGNYIYFAGTLYEHRIESLSLLIDVIENVNISIHLKVRSLGPEHLTHKLRTLVCERGATEFVEILDAESEKVVLKEQQEALINLVPSSIHKEEKALMTTIPGKLFELLVIDRPILAIIPSGSEIGEILSICNKGIATTDRKRISEFIRGSYGEYKGNPKVHDYSRKKQASKLLAELDKTIEGKRR